MTTHLQHSENYTLSIVFLNYNRLVETGKTVNRLRRLVGGRQDIEVIAVDNGSTDGTAEYLKDQHDIRVITLSENRGIAGYNSGFELAAGKYILVLDDDSSPVDEAGLNRAIALLDSRKHIGIVAFRIENPDGTPQWSWHLPHQNALTVSPSFIGCGFMIRRDLFTAIGWYPGEFFLYQNEMDITFKIRLRSYEIYYHPDCRVVHRGHPGSRPGWRRIYYPTRNTIWIIRKYYCGPLAAYMILSRLVIGFVRSLYFCEFPAFLRACHGGFSHPVGAQPVSRRIRRSCAPFFWQNSIFHHLWRGNERAS